MPLAAFFVFMTLKAYGLASVSQNPNLRPDPPLTHRQKQLVRPLSTLLRHFGQKRIPIIADDLIRKSLYFITDKRMSTAIAALTSDDYLTDILSNEAGNSDNVQDIASALSTESSVKARSLAAFLLRYSDEPRLEECLLRLSCDKDAGVRTEAVVSIAFGKIPNAIDKLRFFTKDPDAIVRNRAIYGLSMVKGWKGTEEYSRCLNDPSPVLRRSAIEALAALGWKVLKSFLPEMKILLTDEYGSVRLLALKTIWRIDSVEARRAAAILLDDPSKSVRDKAREILNLRNR